MQSTLFLALSLVLVLFGASSSLASQLTLTAEESCNSLIGTEAHDKLCQNPGLFIFSTVADQESNGDGSLLLKELNADLSYSQVLRNLKDLLVLRLKSQGLNVTWSNFYMVTTSEVKSFLTAPGIGSTKIAESAQKTILNQIENSPKSTFSVFVNIQSRGFAGKLTTKRYVAVLNSSNGLIAMVSKTIYKER